MQFKIYSQHRYLHLKIQFTFECPTRSFQYTYMRLTRNYKKYCRPKAIFAAASHETILRFHEKNAKGSHPCETLVFCSRTSVSHWLLYTEFLSSLNCIVFAVLWPTTYIWTCESGRYSFSRCMFRETDVRGRFHSINIWNACVHVPTAPLGYRYRRHIPLHINVIVNFTECYYDSVAKEKKRI